MQASPLGTGSDANDEDAYDPALIDAIPEVVDAPTAARIEFAPAPARGALNLKSLMSQLDVVSREAASRQLAQVESALSRMLAEHEAKLEELEARAERADREKRELAAQKVRYERAFSALRDLTRDIDTA